MCGNESQFVAPLLRDLFANRRGSITERLAMLEKAHFGNWPLHMPCAAAVQHMITLFSSLSDGTGGVASVNKYELADSFCLMSFALCIWCCTVHSRHC